MLDCYHSYIYNGGAQLNSQLRLQLWLQADDNISVKRKQSRKQGKGGKMAGMKMTPNHFAEIKSAMDKVTQSVPSMQWEVYESRGFSRTRWLWDVFWRGLQSPECKVKSSDLYAYLNDSHIDTALKRIK